MVSFVYSGSLKFATNCLFQHRGNTFFCLRFFSFSTTIRPFTIRTKKDIVWKKFVNENMKQVILIASDLGFRPWTDFEKSEKRLIF